MSTKIFFFIFTLSCVSLIKADETAAPDRSIPFHNFTTLSDALANVEKYALSFNESLNFPALLFAFAVKGKPVLKKAWGQSDLENNLPANVDNKFRLGSISKSFTSAIIGQLVDEGKLKYDDLVYKYLDEAHFSRKSFGGHPVNITLSQLLSHNAGLRATDPKADFFTTLDPPTNVTEQIKKFSKQPLHTAPGTVFEYANLGFQLLGAVIEKVTGKSYQTVMTEFFTKNKFPAALVGDTSKIITNIPRYYTGAAIPEKTMTNPMEGRSKRNTPVCPYDDMVFLNGWWPAGGLVATLDDILHYGKLLIDAYKGRPGAILKQETIKKMWSKHVSLGNSMATFTEHADYGYGWFVSRVNQINRTVVFHAGGIMGVTTQLTILPEEEAVGVTFVNKGVVVEGEQMVLYAAQNLLHLVK